MRRASIWVVWGVASLGLAGCWGDEESYGSGYAPSSGGTTYVTNNYYYGSSSSYRSSSGHHHGGRHRH